MNYVLRWKKKKKKWQPMTKATVRIDRLWFTGHASTNPSNKGGHSRLQAGWSCGHDTVNQVGAREPLAPGPRARSSEITRLLKKVTLNPSEVQTAPGLVPAKDNYIYCHLPYLIQSTSFSSLSPHCVVISLQFFLKCILTQHRRRDC